jgi:hypothetical protein
MQKEQINESLLHCHKDNCCWLLIRCPHASLPPTPATKDGLYDFPHLSKALQDYQYDLDSSNKHNNEAWFQGNKPSTFNESLH